MTPEGRVVNVTKKGQATIPKKLREKYGIRKKALVVGINEGILLKPVPDPSEERGSLKKLFHVFSNHFLPPKKSDKAVEWDWHWCMVLFMRPEAMSGLRQA